MDTSLIEPYTTRKWNLRYDTFVDLRNAFLDNARNRSPLVSQSKVNACISTLAHGFQDRIIATDNPQEMLGVEIQEDDQFITILYAEGPLLRNGGLCSYGSKEHRDLIMWASKQPNCIGHLFLIDGPGGSSWCKNDYLQAKEASIAAHQPWVGLVDGMCASAHQCLAALCDECYYTNPKDEFGCIGTLAAFFTNKDGDIDAVSQERYVEVYATGSPNKNIEFRKAAEGDYELIQKEVDEDAEEFKAIVKAHRPNVTDEILSGKVFTAKEVEGILNDGQSDMEGCIKRIVELWKINESTKGAAQANSTVKQPFTENNNIETLNNKTMKEYNNIQQACGVEALVSDKENGIYATEPMCDALESALAEYKQKENTLEAKLQEISSLNEKIKTMTSDHQSAIDKLNGEHAEAIKGKDDEIATLTSDHQSAIDKLNGEHAEAIKAKDDEIASLNEQIQQLNSTIEEQNGQIAQLSDATTPAPTPSATPANEGAAGQNPLAVQNVCHEGMTPEERRKALEERMKLLR